MARQARRILSGWYHVCYSDELPNEQVLPLSIFGDEAIIWRTTGGEPTMLSAYCPHLGAHIGYGGTVVANTIRCPFHGWTFDSSGVCTRVPYSARNPPRVALKRFNLIEDDGRVLAWHSTESPEPEWFPLGGYQGNENQDKIPNAHKIRHSWHVQSAVEDMVENVADPGHVTELHGLPALHWQIDESRFRRRMRCKPTDDWRVEVTYEGPGLGYSHFQGPTEVLQICSLSPISSRELTLHFEFRLPGDMADKKQRVFSRIFAREMIKTIDEDVVIWNHKRQPEHPVFVAEDKAIIDFRRWLSGTQEVDSPAIGSD